MVRDTFLLLPTELFAFGKTHYTSRTFMTCVAAV